MSTDTGISGILQIIATTAARQPGGELAACAELFSLWNILFAQRAIQMEKEQPSTDPDIAIQNRMVTFIHTHYAEPLTLAEIAKAGYVGRTKCCAIFKKYLNQSPAEFLSSYRLQKSCHLLLESSLKVTDIATNCGFNHLSYFSSLFVKKYGCTPVEYRKRYKLTPDKDTPQQEP